MSYTPWKKIFSYDADVSMVIEARGHGKTFGLREQCLKDYLQDKERFCIVARYEYQLHDIARDYFGALSRLNKHGEPASPIFRERRFVFRRKGYLLQIQEAPALNTEDGLAALSWKPAKEDWETIAYLAALSNYQRYKELTYAGVRRIVFDEALIENPTGIRDYLPDEYERLVSVVDSVTRERADDTGRHKPNVYLLSNSVGGVANPYFAHFGIRSVPPKGFTWHAGKTMLLYVGEDTAYSVAKAKDTVAGRMSRGTRAAAAINDNEFTSRAEAGMIRRKPSNAVCKYGVVLSGHRFSVWVDIDEGYYYIVPRIPRGMDTFALTTSDNTVNYLMARRMEPEIRALCECYRLGLVRFQDESVETDFETLLLPLYGFRA